MSNVLKFTLTGKILKYKERAVLVSGSVGTDYCAFTFDSTWDKFTERKGIFFRHGKTVYKVTLDSDGMCAVPEECLKEEGDLSIGVAGYTDTSVRTSTVVVCHVEEGGLDG